MLTTVRRMFTNAFCSQRVLESGRRLGVVQRLRNIHPRDLAVALVSCAIGDETRSIATARREFGAATGYMPEESSFYGRFTYELHLRAILALSSKHRWCAAHDKSPAWLSVDFGDRP